MLSQYISDSHFDLIAITETWLSDDDLSISSQLTPNKFTLIQDNRSKKGGGVALLYNSNLTVINTSIHSLTSCQVISCRIKCSTQCHFTLILIYRPPHSNIQTFITELRQITSLISSSNTLLLGDFNIHVNTPSSTPNFHQLIYEHSLTQHVSFPTHIHGNTLDLIITPSDSTIISNIYRDLLISDHYAICFSLAFPIPHIPTQFTQYRKITSINSLSFSNHIITSLSTSTSKFPIHIDCLNHNLKLALDLFAPLCVRKSHTKPRSPWFNSDLHNLRLIYRRNNKRWFLSHSPSDLISLKSSRCNYRCKLSSTKSSYYINLLSDLNPNSKKAFDLSFSIIGKHKKKSLPERDDMTLCADFAQFFQDKVKKIIDHLPNCLPISYDQILAYPHHWSCFESPSPSFILHLIQRSKSNSPIDPIPLLLLKNIAPTLILHFCDIIRTSLFTSVVPDSMKLAYITPILKKSSLDTSILSNYRPISQLSTISKVLERVVSSQLTSYLVSNSIADKFQSAYLPLRGTETALTKIIDDIAISIDSNSPTYLILLDLSSAFDTVNHAILSNRLNSIGIHGQVHNWLMSFVSNRSYSIRINNSSSSQFTQAHGVPQGSVLGPILFIIYILPIQAIISKYPLVKYHLYADDLQLYTSFPPHTDHIHIESSLSSCLADLRSWFSVNSLSLNITKTDSIIFSKSNTFFKLTSPDLLSIPTSSIVTTLGIRLSSNLDFSSQISTIIQKAQYFIYNISKVRRKLTFSVTLNLINTLVFSRIRYCMSLYTSISIRLLRKLESIQRRSVRLLYCLRKDDHTSITLLMKTLGWLPARKLAEYQLLCLAHKVVYTGEPEYLADLIKPFSTRVQRSANRYQIHAPSAHSTTGLLAFSVSAPHYWNRLPLFIRSCSNLIRFRKLMYVLLSK